MSDDRSPAALADGLEAAMGATTTLGAELNDSPTAARASAAALTDTIGDIVRSGHEAAANVAAIRGEAAELSKKGGHEAARLRNLDADQAQADGLKAVNDLYQRAQALGAITTAQLRSSAVPQVGTDASRTLARQELLQAVGAERGINAAIKMIRMAENADLSPSVVAEMYSTFGEGLLEDGKTRPDDPSSPITAFRRSATERLLARQPRKMAQLASVKHAQTQDALRAHTAAKLRIGGK
jgi:hypothetical protein